MGELHRLTGSLAAHRELTADEIRASAAALGEEGPSDEEKAAFLSALSAKGETAAEVAGFAAHYRALALNPGLSKYSADAIDIVGTGGDHSGGFNVSTLVTLVVASAGVPVMKHGNRGITSKCGSADLFAAFGFSLEATPQKLQEAMEKLGYVFLFAPAWHPAFRRIAPVRKLLAARGERSVFNILGPLLNPGRPSHIVLGAASPALLEKLADALEILGTQAGLAVHGVIEPGKGIDELTSATVNKARGVGSLRAATAEWTPESFGLERSSFSEITGGDVETNLGIANDLAAGNGPRGLADTVALNSAVALWVAGARPDPRGAIAEARELLLGGAVKAKMSQTKDFFGSHG